MIGLLPTTAIFLATAPTDLRKAYDVLAVLVRQSLGQDPLSGSLYVFLSLTKYTLLRNVTSPEGADCPLGTPIARACRP